MVEYNTHFSCPPSPIEMFGGEGQKKLFALCPLAECLVARMNIIYYSEMEWKWKLKG